tara:strand:+ start:2803 stop:3342 length:540 start_codon:yes stop_codon:yes gene_type:complete
MKVCVAFKKRKKKKTIPNTIDLGSQELVRGDENGTLIRKVDGEKFRLVMYGNDRHLEKVCNSVLDNYYARSLLDIADRERNSRRYWAGCRFEKLCNRAGLDSKVTARLEEYIGGTKEEFIHRNIDAHSEFHSVIKELGAFRHKPVWDILWKVIVTNEPARKRMDEFREALDRLILYYDM